MMMAENNTALMMIGLVLVVLLTAGLTYLIAKSGAPLPPLLQNETNGSLNEPTITVRGEATRTLQPDLLTLGITIETFGANTSEAQDENAAETARVKAALLAAGVKESEIQTMSYYTYEQYNETCYRGCYDYPYYGRDGGYAYQEGVAYSDAKLDIAPMPPYPCERNCSILGYKTTHSIIVKTGNIHEGGRYSEAAMDASNSSRVDYAYFGMKEETRVRIEAELQAEAAAGAKSKAENIARGLGARLGRIVSINPDYYYPYPVYAYDSAAEGYGAAKAPTELFPTDTTMSSSMTVVYALVQ